MPGNNGLSALRAGIPARSADRGQFSTGLMTISTAAVAVAPP